MDRSDPCRDRVRCGADPPIQRNFGDAHRVRVRDGNRVHVLEREPKPHRGGNVKSARDPIVAANSLRFVALRRVGSQGRGQPQPMEHSGDRWTGWLCASQDHVYANADSIRWMRRRHHSVGSACRRRQCVLCRRHRRDSEPGPSRPAYVRYSLPADVESADAVVCSKPRRDSVAGRDFDLAAKASVG